MKRLFLFFGLICFAAFSWSLAAQPAQTQQPSERRFLFIIETSRDMKKMSPAMQQSVADLIGSGLGDVMQDGDTLGVWTFNEEIHTGQFPMQRWTKETGVEVATAVDEFLKKQSFENEARMEKVFRPMFSVIRSSPSIMVVFLTAGEREMMATPYDKQINEYYREHRREYLKKKMPFLTFLLAERGQVIRYSASAALGDVKVPRFPAPPLAKKSTRLPSQPVPRSAPEPQPQPQPPSIKPIAKSGEALVITKEGAKGFSVTDSELANFVASVPKTEPAKPEAAPVATAPTEVSAAPPQTSETKPVEAPAVVNSVPANPSPATQANSASPTPAPAEAKVAATQPLPPVTRASPEPAPVPAANNSAAPVQQIPETTPKTESPVVKENSPKIAAATPLTPENPRPQIAVTATPTSAAVPKYFIVGMALVVVAVIIAFLLGRQTGKRTGPSLITHGVERTKR